MSTSLPPIITSSFTTSRSRPKTFKARTNQTQGFRVSSCKVTPTNDDNHLILPETPKLILPNNIMNVDRRNLLVGLGGACTAANLSSLSSALAAPIFTPNPCKKAHVDKMSPGDVKRTLECCPPNLGKDVKPFEFPDVKEMRMRWPAHKENDYKKQVEKYKEAIKIMRGLDDKHPHSFKQQAAIHCAYCNGGYSTQSESGLPAVELQIHNSWLFFPFHRWYLYFYERILGKLIGDSTFALPYWNWDDRAGMEIPAMFTGDESNPLYDEYRNPDHKKKLVDLAFSGEDKDSNFDTERSNLFTVYRDLVTNAANETSFFGGVYVAGDKPIKIGDPSVGSVEAGSHTAVHRWVGTKNPNGEDMGNFYSAGYDPLFYVHHANVDRMWKLWKALCLPGHIEPAEEEWLNASYLFYDENENLVRVYNKDAVDTKKLGFDYAESDISTVEWKDSRPVKREKKQQVASASSKTLEPPSFPLTLKGENLKVRVERGKAPDEDRTNYKEILLINGINYEGDRFVKFDVFVNDKVTTDEKKFNLSPIDPEYAGGFAQIAHAGNTSAGCGARFGLDKLLDETNFDQGEKYVEVKLVPRTKDVPITIKEIKTDWVLINDSFPIADVIIQELKPSVTLDTVRKVSVKWPNVNKTDDQKAQSNNAVLIIKGNSPNNKFVKFDVFVNDKVNKNTTRENLPTSCSPEYAGRFARLPRDNNNLPWDFEARFELDMDKLKLFGDTKTQDTAVVALVPKPAPGSKDLIITEIKIVGSPDIVAKS